MASFGIFMRKSWFSLVLGWIGVPPMKGTTAVSTASPVGSNVPESLPEARVTIKTHLPLEPFSSKKIKF